MTALVPVWTPEDFAETVADARYQEAIDTADAFYALNALARLAAFGPAVATAPEPVVPPAPRGWWYRGQHRPNGVRQSVAELQAEADAERHPNGCDARLGPCAECRRVFGRPAR